MQLGFEDSDGDYPDIHDSDLDDIDQQFNCNGSQKDNNKQPNEKSKASQDDNWINRNTKKVTMGKPGTGNDTTDINFDDLRDSLGEEEEKDPLDLQKKRTMPSTVANGVKTSNVFIKGDHRTMMRDGKQVILPQPKIGYKSQEILKNQHKFSTEGIEVYFPFKPYQCQVDFMGKVIKALNNNENALLESPTGTGKTLSLLCASLAWLKRQRDRDSDKPMTLESPRIIYTSRTHSQLAQVQRELVNTGYNPRSVVIGSRDHFCIHPQISLLKGFLLSTACKKSQKGLDPCIYYKNRDFAKQNLSWEPLDIEELHEVGKKMMVCPYFGNKDRVSGADIIFMPYNYLIDEKIRENYEINYANSCIIFDEAHNVAACAEDVTSFELKSKLMDSIVIELQKLKDEMRLDDEKAWDSTEDDVDNVIQMARLFQDYLEKIDLNQQSVPGFQIDNQYLKKDSLVLPGSAIFDIFFKGTKSNTIRSKQKSIVNYLERETQISRDVDLDGEWFSKWDPIFQKVLADIGALSQYNVQPSLEAWYTVIRRVMRIRKGGVHPNKKGRDEKPQEPPSVVNNDSINDFYVYIYDEEDQSNQLHFNQKGKRRGKVIQTFIYDIGGGSGVMFNQQSRVLGFWCFNAGIGFREIQALKPKSIILTSGTLSPLNSFQAELQLNFNQRIENPHVINAEQVSINILSRGVKDNAFNFSFQNRDNEGALIDLGMSISAISQVTPGGMLIFFPSYRVMEKCHELWDQSNVRTQIEKSKKLFLEPKDPTKYQQTMDRYYKSIFKPNGKITGNGAILMGVCRGRISEGLDFSDNAARCVIVVGIPYPQMTDPKVILKKDYLDKKFRQPNQFQNLSGKDWYGQQATRAVNQAIGRVIRHVQDYGSIILIDERYNWGTMRSQISKWLRDRIKPFNNFSDMQKNLQTFFKDMESKKFKPKLEQLGQVQLEIDDDINNRNSKGKVMDTKSQTNTSEDEDMKQEQMLSGIFNKNTTNSNKQPVVGKAKGTITRFFSKDNNDKKRTYQDVFDDEGNNSQIISQRSKLKPAVTMKFGIDKIESNSNQRGGKLGFISDEDIQDDPQNFNNSFGLANKQGGFSSASSVMDNKLQGFKFKPHKDPKDSKLVQVAPGTGTEEEEKKPHPERNKSADGGRIGGIYSSDNVTMQEKQQIIKKVIEEMKRFLDKNELAKLLGIFKEVKSCERIEPTFKKLKEIFFGKIVSVKQDKNFRDKIKCLSELGQLIPKKFQDEYKGLVESLE